ncbi:ABC transporter permease [Aurantimonas sp. A2-1-M11]|uniref:ABC transporter permease n=1 Tax=Aurantimonas sp. A2-1-M11 TaxID=3113712 RepID=UPI002F93401F
MTDRSIDTAVETGSSRHFEESEGQAGVLTDRIRQMSPSAGLWSSLPLSLLLLAGFFGPLVLVVLYSFMPRGSFSPIGWPTLENYRDIVEQNFYISFGWSLLMAMISTVILLLVAYPLAVTMVRLAGKRADIYTVAIVAPLFVAENIRLQGWSLFFDKGGFLDGTAESLLGVGTGSLVGNIPIVIFGLVYVYLPFMLFPLILGLTNVAPDAREAASDLGATRFQVFRDIELPLAAPGILIGTLLCFVLALGAVSEAKFLGKGAVIPIVQDIDSAFTFGQNWPRGAALSVLLILIAAAAILVVMRRVDIDRMFTRR